MESQSTQQANIDVNPKAQKYPPFHFHNQFQGIMTMFSDPETVKEYLDAHQRWFVHCAKPMKAQPIGENSYALTIGRFGALGFEVEPKLGVELLPETGGVYRMETVPLDNSDGLFYDVDYQAELQLKETPAANSSLRSSTVVEWTLDLGVTIYFPRFIYRFSPGMVQKTGDRVLSQIVRQVSRRLTHKVQADFHNRYDLPLPS